MMDCGMIPVDMGTFICPLDCDELCRVSRDLCKDLKNKLHNSLKDGRPRQWERQIERSGFWRAKERDRVTDALAPLPERLLRNEDFEVYRMVSSADKGNPASNLERSITLYDNAFSADSPKLTRIMAHELAHLLFRSMSEDEQQAYRVAANWVKPPKGKQFVYLRKSSEFIEPDGMISPEEDFANNIEAALVDDIRLKKISPGISRWIHSFFGDKFVLGGPCGPSSKKQ
jgi:hypothetical protein